MLLCCCCRRAVGAGLYQELSAALGQMTRLNVSGRKVVCWRLHPIDLAQQVQLLSDTALQLAVSGHGNPIAEKTLVMHIEPRPALQVVERRRGCVLSWITPTRSSSGPVSATGAPVGFFGLTDMMVALQDTMDFARKRRARPLRGRHAARLLRQRTALSLRWRKFEPIHS